jgi:hypothetical protein
MKTRPLCALVAAAAVVSIAVPGRAQDVPARSVRYELEVQPAAVPHQDEDGWIVVTRWTGPFVEDGEPARGEERLPAGSEAIASTTTSVWVVRPPADDGSAGSLVLLGQFDGVVVKRVWKLEPFVTYVFPPDAWHAVGRDPALSQLEPR